MRIDHVALYARDLEGLRSFYERYFEAESGPKYVNAGKQFASYFLRFPGGARLELMHKTSVAAGAVERGAERLGWIHIAFAAGSGEAVDTLTRTLGEAGYEVVDGPRWTGDGYYESVVLDPEGNRIEITI